MEAVQGKMESKASEEHLGPGGGTWGGWLKCGWGVGGRGRRRRHSLSLKDEPNAQPDEDTQQQRLSNTGTGGQR
eukprot:scaffold10458_cov107-Isochrysis_galbana.AAC.3